MIQNKIFNGFDIDPKRIKDFTCHGNMFIITLITGKVIHHYPPNPSDFRDWLQYNNIPGHRVHLPLPVDAHFTDMASVNPWTY